MLFVSAKVSQFALTSAGTAGTAQRVESMVAKMDELGFGSCSNTYACEAECPKGNIGEKYCQKLNREYFMAKLKSSDIKI